MFNLFIYIFERSYFIVFFFINSLKSSVFYVKIVNLGIFLFVGFVVVVVLFVSKKI